MQYFNLLANTGSHEIGYMLGLVFGFVAILAVPAFFIVSLIKALTKKTKGWVISLVLSSLCLLGLGSVVGYAAVKAVKRGQAVTADELKSGKENTQLVTTDDDLLRFTIPSKWTEIRDLHDEASLKYGHLAGEHYMLVLTESKTDFDEGVALRDYADLCLENTKAASTNMKLGEWVETDLDHGKLLTVELSATVDRIKIKYYYGFYESKGHYHQVMQWTLHSKWGSSRPVFDAVIKSIETVNPEDYLESTGS